MSRFIIRRYRFGFRIVEVVGQGSHFGTLAIQWDGLFQTENRAVSHIETALKTELSYQKGAYHYEKITTGNDSKRDNR
jgi:hypothetical protein